MTESIHKAAERCEIVSPAAVVHGKNHGRSPVMWYGGKGRLAPWILSFIPPTKLYAEPFAGGASVFFQMKPRPVEALNDLDKRIVTLFRVLQGPDFAKLAHRIRHTLYSVEEFKLAIEVQADPQATELDLAWATFVGFKQGIGGKCKTGGNWGRVIGTSRNGMAETPSKWRSRLSLLEIFSERLSRAQIDCRPAVEFIRYWDDPAGCLYVDPPYAHETRASGHCKEYAHEMTSGDHDELLQMLSGCRSAVVLSGYRTDAYDRLNWTRHDRETACHAAAKARNTTGVKATGTMLAKVPRTESVWLNPRCEELLGGRQQRLFD